MIEDFKKRIFSLQTADFEEFALEVFNFQAVHNPVYARYLAYLKKEPKKIKQIQDIPFLPIELFKYHKILSSSKKVQTIFESSATTGQIRSKHYIVDLDFYEKISQTIFEKHYGELSQYVLLALLPSYLERQNSSLVFMINQFMQKTQSGSGFFLYNFDELAQKIEHLLTQNQKIMLWGVSFALLDFAEKYPIPLTGQLLMDTGGMKGRGREPLRMEVRDRLEKAFQTPLHSEYGMTELLSQAYNKTGLFEAPTWLKIYLRDINDPFCIDNSLRQGGINVVDLANLDTCCFIETKDLARLEGNKFELLGRYDNSEIRGCSLLYV